ncbi:hypothetical protein H0H92_009478 [Tricholoma furcatifolium]|nr:hypothetical protein H0H92_009478 [Tricholoma furcatifolium]
MQITSNLLIILPPVVTTTLAATITLVEVQNPSAYSVLGVPTASATIYPIGTGANGETTYVEDMVVNYMGYSTTTFEANGESVTNTLEIIPSSIATGYPPVTLHNKLIFNLSH